MKTLISIFFVVLTSQLYGFDWPNSLTYTLKPSNNVDFKENVIGFEVIDDGSDDLFIGKFKNYNQAETAQIKLDGIGIETELMAFFRRKSISLWDAKILSENLNWKEEKMMLKSVSKEENKSKEIKPKKEELYVEIVKEAYFTIQLGVFSKSSKQNFKIEVKEIVIDGKYYCFYGEYFSIEESNKELIVIKNKGHQDAYITGFYQGEKVSPSVVKNKMKKL